MQISPAAQRLIGRLAWIMAWVGLVVGELHALARHATADGKDDLNLPLTRAWSVPASRGLRPLLDWSDPDTVYLTYGKIWLPVFAAFTLCAFVVHQRRRPAGFEKWAWRVALTGYVILTLAVFGAYYTPWIEQSFLLLTISGLLISLVGSTMLGVALLRNRFRPRATAWLLALWIPLFIGIVQVTSLGNAALPVVFAFGSPAAALRAKPASSRTRRPVDHAMSVTRNEGAFTAGCRSLQRAHGGYSAPFAPWPAWSG